MLYSDPTHIHVNIVEQTEELLLAIFGFIAFDFDLQTLDNEGAAEKNELAPALRRYVTVFPIIMKLPAIVSRIYLLFNRKYQHARKIINEYVHRMIEQELRETETTRAERKRKSLIASLVASLQKDERLEATKSEEEKRGR